MPITLTLEQKLHENLFFLGLLEKMKQYNITNTIGVYEFIYGPVVKDMEAFLDNEKNELDESTKYAVQSVIKGIYPRIYNRAKYDEIQKIIKINNLD